MMAKHSCNPNVDEPQLKKNLGLKNQLKNFIRWVFLSVGKIFVFLQRINFKEIKRKSVMAKAYWLNIFRSVRDPAKLAEYVKLAGPVLKNSGARFLVRGHPAKVFEAGLMQRTVIMEFDSLAQALAVYESPEYQAALQALGDGAERDVRIIEAFHEQR